MTAISVYGGNEIVTWCYGHILEQMNTANTTKSIKSGAEGLTDNSSFLEIEGKIKRSKTI